MSGTVKCALIAAALVVPTSASLAADCEALRAEAMAVLKQPQAFKDMTLIAMAKGFPAAAKKNRVSVLAAADRVYAWIDESDAMVDKFEAAGCGVGDDAATAHEKTAELRKMVEETVKLTEAP